MKEPISKPNLWVNSKVKMLKSGVWSKITLKRRNVNRKNLLAWNQNDLSLKFLELGGFPQVAGCINDTMISIDAPKLRKEHYVNRHGQQELNAIMLCGPDRSFYAVNANWGSVHDSRVLRNTKFYSNFKSGFRPFPGEVTLGDSANPLRDWLTIK